MNFKISLLPLLSLTLGGCVTAISARVSDETKPEKLRADNQGVVLVHTSLHQQSCERITMALAQADGFRRLGSGR
jgi:hypothetical protein